MLDFTLSFAEACRSFFRFDEGLDTPQRSEPAAPSSEYHPPLSVYECGVNDDGDKLYRIREGRIGGSMPTVNGVSISDEESAFTLANGNKIWIKLSDNIVEFGAALPADTTTNGYILLGLLNASGELTSLRTTSLDYYHCSDNWIFYAV